MEAEQVIEKILSDARNEADKILNDGREKAAAVESEQAKELEQYNTKTEELARQAADDRKAHMLASARMEIAKKTLAEKRKILDEVFEHARGRFKDLPEYSEVMAELMVKAAETGEEEVVIDKNEGRINAELISQVNNRLGEKGNLKLSQDRADIGGGFILKRGKINNNVSLGVLLEQAREELEIELGKELFSD